MASHTDGFRVAGAHREFSRNKMLVVLLVPLMMSLMQVSAINTVLVSIEQSLHASDTDIQWMMSGYALAFGIFLVPAGRIGDIFGRSAGFVSGLAIFSIASLLCGLSNDPTHLNLMRALQGFGSAVLSPQITGLIQQYFDGRARARAFALFGLTISASVAAGPVLSGGLIAILGPEIGWRTQFLMNFPLGLIGIVLAFYWLPFGKERRTIGPKASQAAEEHAALEEAQGRPAKDRSGKTRLDLDPIGMVTLAVSTVLIMVPFMLKTGPWIYLLAVVGGILMALWVMWEKHYKARGGFTMVDLDLFKIFTYRYGIAVSSVLFLGMTSVWTVLLLFVQSALHATPFELGLLSLPNALVSAYASIWAGRYAVEKGASIQFWSLVIYIIGLLGCVVVVYFTMHGASFWWFILPTLPMGWGGGAIGSANQTQTMLDVPAKMGGTAGGVMQTGQRMATAIGIAIITAIFFAARGPVDAQGQGGNWFMAITAALLAIVVILVIDLWIAWRFYRLSRPEAQSQDL